MELYLLRHAHAGDPAKWHAGDADRPLSRRGRGQAERLGRFLARSGFRPDAIISSPKRRASETAEIVAEALGVSWRTDDRLASGFDLWDLERLVREAANPARLMIVGHDPDFSALLAELTGAPAMPMPKGALARVDIDGPPGAGTAVLRWLVPPELLEAG